MELKKVQFKNEKGNVSVKARDEFRKQVMSKAIRALADEFNEGVYVNANGGISVPIAISASDGNTIYANFTLTVSDNNPDIVKEKKPKTKKTADEVEIPSLF